MATFLHPAAVRNSSPPRHATTFCVMDRDDALTRRYLGSVGWSAMFFTMVWRVTTHCSCRGGGVTSGLRMLVTARMSRSLTSWVRSAADGEGACDGVSGVGGERLWGAHLLLFSGCIFLGTGDGGSGTHLGGLRGLRRGGRRCGGSCRGSLRGGDASPLRVPFHALAAALSGHRIP